MSVKDPGLRLGWSRGRDKVRVRVGAAGVTSNV